MKIVSWNVNGLRAIFNKGFFKWFKEIEADIVCLQEIKLQESQLSKQLISPGNYFSYFSFAEKKGYSGVGIYTKEKPLKTEKQLGLSRFDQEGRILKLEYPDFTLVNLYIPHGGRKKENLRYKIDVYKTLLDQLKKLSNKKIIIIGDFNIAHKEIDLARPKDNRKNIMFTDEERGQIDKILNSGFIDSFRRFNKEGGNYTWWPYYLNARQRNLGWRIDYAFVSRPLESRLKSAFILKNVYGSDHCPIGVKF